MQSEITMTKGSNVNDLLIECRLRCDRAEEHLCQLNANISSYLEFEKGKVFATMDEKTNIASLGFTAPPEGPPPTFSILIGEIVYNLRASLDYLVFLLALVDSGVEQNRTQFPIYDSDQDFRRNAPTRLCGICDSNVGRLEALQPYRSIKWTRTLRDLSNPDKHRHLTMLSREGQQVLTVKKHEEGYDTEFELPLEVCFENGNPVLATLRDLHGHVLDTVVSFEDVLAKGPGKKGKAC